MSSKFQLSSWLNFFFRDTKQEYCKNIIEGKFKLLEQVLNTFKDKKTILQPHLRLSKKKPEQPITDLPMVEEGQRDPVFEAILDSVYLNRDDLVSAHGIYDQP